MNLYAFLSNDPLTTLDEYGLHDVGSLAMLHRWKGDGYAVSPRDQNLMKGYAGAAHGAVQFGVNILHEWQAIATQIGTEQLELGRHSREAAIGAVERMQSSQSLALDSYLRNQFSVSRTDVSYNTGYAAGMYGAEVGSVIVPAYGIAKGVYTLGRMGYASWRAGGAFRAAERLAVAKIPKIELNRFHTAARNLSEVGQNNIRILRSWAKSKGWERLPNPQGRPEIWGETIAERFEFRLKIKAESSLRSGLDSGSGVPRFDARLSEGVYINPFTSEVGNSKIGTHIPLGCQFYE